MNGQWVGAYAGANNGFAIINIDDMGDHYDGIGYFLNKGESLPTIFTRFKTLDQSESFQLLKNSIFPINPITKVIDTWDNVRKHYKDIPYSNYVDVEGNYNAARLSLKWKTELGMESSCELPRNIVKSKSELVWETWTGA